MEFKGALVSARGMLANPWVNNGLTLVGGGVQAAAGLFIGTVTSPTGIGAVAGGVIAVQGAASASVALGNLVNLAMGVTPVVNNTGIVGLGTSIVTLGTSSKETNNIAMATDMGLSLFTGGVGTVAANQALLSKTSALTLNGHILDTTFGAGKWLPVMKSPSAIENTTNILGASSNVAGAYDK
ncbi:MAG: hypothetical protein EHM79_11040 [Geobacter sp.]|nr:MAG: hypothetical protein EHM79_11040 [Geobacter sp.]